jgi:hypothetical protein
MHVAFSTLFPLALWKHTQSYICTCICTHKLSRTLFLLQMAMIQGFIIYVRIMAKQNNDRTPIVMENPISGMFKTQLDQGGNAMVKNLASSFLSSSTTIMEYDLRQASSMQGTIIFTMAFMWLLHFKLNMVQPLLQQIVTGFMNLAVNPLFQVYVLGRNLERPFKTAVSAAQKMAELKAGTEEEAAGEDDGDKSEISVEDKDDAKEETDESESEDVGGEEEEGIDEGSENGEADAEEESEESPAKDEEKNGEEKTVEENEEVKDEAKQEEDAK